MATFSCAFVGTLAVIVHRDVPPSKDEWAQQIADLGAMPAVNQYRVLVYSAGGAPSYEQRADLNATLHGVETHTAVVTPSLAVRGICTAMSWFNPRLKVFTPLRIEEAADYLNMSREERVRAFALMRRLILILGMQLPIELPTHKTFTDTGTGTFPAITAMLKKGNKP